MQLKIDSYQETTSGGNAKVFFCKNWTAAREVLEILIVSIKNPIFKVVVRMIISAGDSLKKDICE